MNQKVESIIWDWNGTLLADVEICILAMNRLLSPRGLPLLDYERYRDIFTFPVIDYYQKLGFDFEKDPFEKVGIDFIDIYHQMLEDVQLAQDAKASLDWFKLLGVNQYILSAMEQASLVRTVQFHDIFGFFKDLAGISDFYGGGKFASGKQLFANKAIDPSTAWLIGDTIHDYEVSQKLGCQCVLTAHGHQSIHKLRKAGVPVLENLSELPAFFASI
jgi:phosphoglycolate phosphatase